MNSSLKMGKTEWTLLVVLSILWGGSFFFAKVALVDIPPLTLVFLRVSLAAVVLGIVLRLNAQSFRASRSLWLAFAGMGLLNNLIPFSLLFYGQTQIGAGLASIFNAMVPMFTILVAHGFTADEKLSQAKVLGVGVGLVGVAALIGVDVYQGVSLHSLIAMLACVTAALSYGFASVYGRRFNRLGVTPMFVAFGQVTATAVMMLPLCLLIEQPLSLPVPSTASIAAVACLALFSTALAYVLFFRILAAGGATSISLVTFLIPISAISLGAVFLGETLRWNHGAGALLIFAGLLLINDSLRQTLARQWASKRRRRTDSDARSKPNPEDATKGCVPCTR